MMRFYPLRVLEVFLISIFAVLAVAANPVVPKSTGYGYGHGKYPSWGKKTHPGIDILAPKNSEIYAFADGEVVDIQGNQVEDCKKNSGLGNLVVIKHFAMPNGKIFYTIYLHLESTPPVKIGEKVFGGKTVIGKIGRTGAANCNYHTHFEIRYFSNRILPDENWNKPYNIYGNGDKSNSEVFKTSWEDPLFFFKKYPTGMRSSATRMPPISQLPKTQPVPQTIVLEIPTLFLFDVSGSMNDNNKIGQAKNSSLIALNEIQENKRLKRGDSTVSVWTFSGGCSPDTARQILPFTANLTQVENTLRAKLPRPDGGTPLPQAINKALNQVSLFMSSRPQTNEGRIILLSDGQSTCGEIRPAGIYSQAQTITIKNIRFLTIGFDVPPGSPAERDLQYLASSSGGQYFPAQNQQELSRAFEKTIRIYLPKILAGASAEFENVVNAILNRDFQKARRFASDFVQTNPNDAFGYYNLAVALEALSRYKGAAENYRKYLQLAPGTDDRREIEVRIEKLEQDYRNQFLYYRNLLQSDLDYLKAYYQRLFNRENEKNAAEFAGFVSEKQTFYANLTDILEIRASRIERSSKDFSDSLSVLNRRVGLQSFDRDAVSLLTISIAHLEDVIERVENYTQQNLP